MILLINRHFALWFLHCLLLHCSLDNAEELFCSEVGNAGVFPIVTFLLLFVPFRCLVARFLPAVLGLVVLTT